MIPAKRSALSKSKGASDGDRGLRGTKSQRGESAPAARPAGAEWGDGGPASDGERGFRGTKSQRGEGAPAARPAGAEWGDGGPASDGERGLRGTKSPGY